MPAGGGDALQSRERSDPGCKTGTGNCLTMSSLSPLASTSADAEGGEGKRRVTMIGRTHLARIQIRARMLHG